VASFLVLIASIVEVVFLYRLFFFRIVCKQERDYLAGHNYAWGFIPVAPYAAGWRVNLPVYG